MYTPTVRAVVFVACTAFAAVCGNAAEIELRKPTACRLMDTRHVGGFNVGAKVASAVIETQDHSLDNTAFSAGGRDYNYQGGQSECRIPDVASGAILSAVVFAPDSTGNATIWPYGAAQPLSTTINSSGALNEVTGLQVPIGTNGRLALAASITGAHYIIDLTGWVLPCNPEETFEFSYSASQSSISVPEAGDINLLKYDYPGASIWVGGAASQPGLYTVTGSEISSGRQRLFVTPAPQSATDQGSEVHLLPGGCSRREIALDGVN